MGSVALLALVSQHCFQRTENGRSGHSRNELTPEREEHDALLIAFTRPSTLPLTTTLESSLNLTQLTVAACPRNFLDARPDVTSQTMTILSMPQEAIVELSHEPQASSTS